MKKLTKKVLLGIMIATSGIAIAGCTEADKVSSNVSQEAETLM